jgi:hypothetical protein
MTEATLEKWFSLYIRLRDSDENGYIRCFTCRGVRFYKYCDAGHGIGRQHKATKYNEKNVHAQCKKCNGLEGGMRERYKEEMNKRYGDGTWDRMEVLSRISIAKRNKFDLTVLSTYFMNKAKTLAKQKGIAI